MDPILAPVLHKPNNDALTVIGNTSDVIRYMVKKPVVTPNFPIMARAIVSQCNATI